MTPTRIRVLTLATAALLLALAGCSSSNNKESSLSQQHLPLGPETPCVYPTAPQLVQLADASNVVTKASVMTGSFKKQGPAGVWTFPLQNVSVISAAPGATTPTVISEIGVAGDPLLPPGDYILFLLQNAAQAPGHYFVTDGYQGLFEIKGGQAVRQCKNQRDPLHPLAASGTPLTTADLIDVLPKNLPLQDLNPKRS